MVTKLISQFRAVCCAGTSENSGSHFTGSSTCGLVWHQIKLDPKFSNRGSNLRKKTICGYVVENMAIYELRTLVA